MSSPPPSVVPTGEAVPPSAGEADQNQDAAAALTSAPAASSPPRRALTFEEFREFYVASKKSDFARQSATPEAVHHPRELEEVRTEEDSAERERRRRLAADLCADLTALAQERHGGVRQRVHGLADLPPATEDTRAAAAGGRAPPPPAQPQLQGLGVLARLGGALSSIVEVLMRWVADNVAHLIQFALLGYLVYTQSNNDVSLLLMVMGAFAVFSALRAVVRSFRIGHETGTVSAPSFLGRLFKPEGQTGPVSCGCKFGYVVAKCVEALLLSISPTYSIERLETELGVDGIVR